MRHGFAWSVLMLALGCGGGAPPDRDAAIDAAASPACRSDAECTGSASSCPGGVARCVAGQCHIDCAAAGTVGAPCATSADCSGAARCLTESIGYTGGYCTAACGATTDCPADAACWSYTGPPPQPWCYRRCEHDADCRAGYRCTAAGAEQVCAPCALTRCA